MRYIDMKIMVSAPLTTAAGCDTVAKMAAAIYVRQPPGASAERKWQELVGLVPSVVFVPHAPDGPHAWALVREDAFDQHVLAELGRRTQLIAELTEGLANATHRAVVPDEVKDGDTDEQGRGVRSSGGGDAQEEG